MGDFSLNNLKCLKYLLRHKYYVAKECFKMGLYWRGLVHDLSKFLPSEWIAYRDYFYGDGKEDPFNLAWLKHQHRNKHHHQHWVLRNDDGTVVALRMPTKYLKEMLCDWVGAGIAITGKREYKSWYENNKHKMVLHPETRCLVEAIMRDMD